MHSILGNLKDSRKRYQIIHERSNRNKSENVKLGRQNHRNITSSKNHETRIEMTSCLTDDLSKEHTREEQTSSYDRKGLSPKSLPTAPTIARALKFETVANALNVTLADCSIILVGQLVKHRTNHQQSLLRQRQASGREWSTRTRP